MDARTKVAVWHGISSEAVLLVFDGRKQKEHHKTLTGLGKALTGVNAKALFDTCVCCLRNVAPPTCTCQFARLRGRARWLAPVCGPTLDCWRLAVMHFRLHTLHFDQAHKSLEVPPSPTHAPTTFRLFHANTEFDKDGTGRKWWWVRKTSIQLCC
jgi:hypothetical protein